MIDFKAINRALIVSCYLEGMTGCEKEFIASVANHPKVAGLRVEGVENVRFAKQVIPKGKFIIGLKKAWGKGRYMITPNLEYSGELAYHGADIIATEDYLAYQYIVRLEQNTCTRLPVMLDFSFKSYRIFRESDYRCLFTNDINAGNIILATTFADNPYSFNALVDIMREDYPAAIINCEGGLMNDGDVKLAFMTGANWVTIGKAINDPATIINNIFPF